ncbi:hypothetical protein DES35_10579 [Schleiferia thermophila]|jgi:hypothetical protein|uniref:Uncharacterized protein n=1 Tax=Schleiferia thermophila TaxID=884107 RepID=A0A369A0Z9_9FLAO|nr:hypothetical protein DES35_10579 [Schleiferia thermophila]
MYFSGMHFIEILYNLALHLRPGGVRAKYVVVFASHSSSQVLFDAWASALLYRCTCRIQLGLLLV